MVITRNGAWALALAGVLAVSGCGESRDYAVPDHVCDVPVNADALSPLLPAGEEVADSPLDKVEDSRSCRVRVDRSLVLYLAQDITERSTDAVSLKMDRQRDPAPVEGVGDKAAVSDRSVIATADCTYQGAPKLFVGYIELKRETPVPEDIPARRDALVALLKSWFPAAAKATGCVS